MHRGLIALGLIAVAAVLGGWLNARTHQLTFPPPENDTFICSSLVGADVVDHLVVRSGSSQTTATESIQITLADNAPEVAALVYTPNSPNASSARRCLGLPDDQTAIATKIDGGRATISSEVSDVRFADHWRLAWHTNHLQVSFNPQSVCFHQAWTTPQAQWAGSNLTLRTDFPRAPSALSPLPDQQTADTAVWSRAGVSCDEVPVVTEAVPIGFSTYLSTLLQDSRLGGQLSISEIVGWSQPILVGLIAAYLAWRSKASGRKEFKVILVALLGVLAAGIDLETLTSSVVAAALMVLIYGSCAALLFTGGGGRRLLLAVTVLLAAGGGAWIGISYSSIVGLTLLEGIAILLLIQIGTIGYREIRGATVRDAPPAATEPNPVRRVRAGNSPWSGDRIRGFACGLIGIALLVALAFDIGDAPEPQTLGSVVRTGYFATRYVIAALAIVLIGIALVRPLLRSEGPLGAGVLAAGAFGWAVLTQQNPLSAFGVQLPVGEVILTLLIVRVVVRPAPDEIARPAPDEIARPAPDEMARPAAEAKSGPTPVEALANSSPRPTALENMVLAAKCAAVLAVVPFGYFALTTATGLPRHWQQPGPGLLFAVAGVLAEAARWLISGLFYGALSPRLPGRVGPLKALSLAGAWFAAAEIVHLINGWTLHDTTRGWSFPGLELLLFLVAFSVVWDALIARRFSPAGAAGTWTEAVETLREAYFILTTKSIVLYSVPVILALLAVGQQLVNGTGLDFVRAALNLGTPLAGGH
ncbi:hypothetical protein SAMN05892883_2916 [Jatrophihabitans sp. GAS493]|uniref:DUF6185 family protein n=1 Tax=Jatrophihabitans sp. GAS493 TaxID=1907575 RepID=UPI000BB7B869|nr:DUF6185 family protein [Jatrophihabitans sp. GAS493]SOD73644.1 hypothetical protein SAMN05892883_2916 [Jatrophihabitans sp. GAS493]